MTENLGKAYENMMECLESRLGYAKRCDDINDCLKPLYECKEIDPQTTVEELIVPREDLFDMTRYPLIQH
jgi:hypothetical protein